MAFNYYLKKPSLYYYLPFIISPVLPKITSVLSNRKEVNLLKQKVPKCLKKTNQEQVTYIQKGAKKHIAQPQEIESFNLRKENFVSREVRKLRGEKKYLFLKPIVGGYTSLFESKDKKGRSYLFIQKGKDGAIEEIPRKTAHTFIGQFFNDCNQDALFDEKRLKKKLNYRPYFFAIWFQNTMNVKSRMHTFIKV